MSDVCDAIEIFDRIYLCFGIRVTDADAEAIRTVGELSDLVQKKMQPPRQCVCLSRIVFCRLKRELGLPSRTRPAQPLDLSLRDSRRQPWDALQQRIGLVLPRLVVRRAIYRLIIALLVLQSTGGLVLLAVGNFPGLAGALLLVGVLPAAWLWYRLSRRWATQLPACCTTVGNLARAVVGQNFPQLVSAHGGWTRGDVWQTVRGIVAGQTCIDPLSIGRDTRFEEDLGYR